MDGALFDFFFSLNIRCDVIFDSFAVSRDISVSDFDGAFEKELIL